MFISVSANSASVFVSMIQQYLRKQIEIDSRSLWLFINVRSYTSKIGKISKLYDEKYKYKKSKGEVKVIFVNLFTLFFV